MKIKIYPKVRDKMKNKMVKIRMKNQYNNDYFDVDLFWGMYLVGRYSKRICECNKKIDF